MIKGQENATRSSDQSPICQIGEAAGKTVRFPSFKHFDQIMMARYEDEIVRLYDVKTDNSVKSYCFLTLTKWVGRFRGALTIIQSPMGWYDGQMVRW